MKQVSENTIKTIPDEIELDMTVVCKNFAMNCITRAVFGLELDAVKEKEHPFIKHGNNVINVGRILMADIFPQMAWLFGIGKISR